VFSLLVFLPMFVLLHINVTARSRLTKAARRDDALEAPKAVREYVVVWSVSFTLW